MLRAPNWEAARSLATALCEDSLALVAPLSTRRFHQIPMPAPEGATPERGPAVFALPAPAHFSSAVVLADRAFADARRAVSGECVSFSGACADSSAASWLSALECVDIGVRRALLDGPRFPSNRQLPRIRSRP